MSANDEKYAALRRMIGEIEADHAGVKAELRNLKEETGPSMTISKAKRAWRLHKSHLLFLDEIALALKVDLDQVAEVIGKEKWRHIREEATS